MHTCAMVGTDAIMAMLATGTVLSNLNLIGRFILTKNGSTKTGLEFIILLYILINYNCTIHNYNYIELLTDYNII